MSRTTGLASLAAALVGCALATSASAAVQVTDFAGGSFAPLTISGDVSGHTLLPATAELEIVTAGGFKNAFEFFISRALAQDIVANPVFQMPRRNTPVQVANPTQFINTFFVLNSDAAGRGGYVVDIGPQFLNPLAAGSSLFELDLRNHAAVFTALSEYAADVSGTYALVHIVQQSGDGTDGARVAYGDLVFIPEPSSAIAGLLVGSLLIRRR